MTPITIHSEEPNLEQVKTGNTRTTHNRKMLKLQPDRYFSSKKDVRRVASRLFEEIRELPIVSPHGHADPMWFASNQPLGDPTAALVQVDHYVIRMLYSQGVKLGELGIFPKGQESGVTQRNAWRTFASNYQLFRGTPVRLWLDYIFSEIFGFTAILSKETADRYFELIDRTLRQDDFLPNGLLRQFNLEYLSTTDRALDTLEYHQVGEHPGTLVVPTFRPDDVVDPDTPNFATNLEMLGGLTGENTSRWTGYLAALAIRRKFFRSKGATATDHGHPTANTADLAKEKCQRLLDVCLSGTSTAEERELFRSQMLTEMAGMSIEDELVMQLHPGSLRNHNRPLYRRYGPDMGADIPSRISFVNGLRPLLEKYGASNTLTFVVFTLDPSVYSRELAPLAGHYPAVKLGAPWWFQDSPEGMLRFRRETTETAGFANLVGFCDDTRSLLSIPARHDLARRIDCRYLAELVLDHRLTEDDALEIALDLTYLLPKRVYRVPESRKAQR